MASINPWGDPASASFRKKHIREVRVDGKVALVNEKILAACTRMIEALSLHEVALPERIPSYDPLGTEHQRLGLAVRLDVPYSPELGEILTEWGFKGVAVDGDPLPEFRFEGDVQRAIEFNDKALTAHLNTIESEEVSGPTPYRWPGHRDIVAGDRGQDVAFLQLLFKASNQDGVADEELFAVVRRFQERRGGAQTGLIDRELWKRIIPKRLPMLFSGDSGFMVRVLQAGLAAQELTSTRVTGVWGVLTSRDVRALQKENGLRTGNFVRGPEWALVLGPTFWGDDDEYEDAPADEQPAESTSKVDASTPA
jgi:hypothetical protein